MRLRDAIPKQFPIRPERPERYQRGHESQRRTPYRPVVFDVHLQEQDHVTDEQHTVQHPEEIIGGRVAEGVFERHGDAKEHQEGEAFDKGDEAEAAQFGLEEVEHGGEVFTGAKVGWRARLPSGRNSICLSNF
jgi:hypothetical protein